MRREHEESVEMVIQSYPPCIGRSPGPPLLLMEGFPALPGEDYIAYGRRVAMLLGVPPAR